MLKKLLLTVVCLIGFVVSGNSQNVNTLSSTVEFVVNTNEFVHNEDYNNFIKNTVHFINNNADDIENILLIGSASPEGNIKHNTHLAEIRADKIYSYICNYIPKSKVIINNDYDLFLKKTGLNENDYSKLRATYIEVKLKYKEEPIVQTDTVYIEKLIEKTDTIYVNNLLSTEKKDTIVLSLYNNLIGDFTIHANLGGEIYFKKLSYFAECSFSDCTLLGMNYNLLSYHTGIRKYFNENYDKFFIEGYGRVGHFDTDIFWENGKFGVFIGGGIGIGYKFNLCTHWKIYPVLRFGFDEFFVNDYYSTNQKIIVNVIYNNQSPVSQSEEGTSLILNSRAIDKRFYNNCYKVSWVGPTYIGLTIQRDFHKYKNK